MIPSVYISARKNIEIMGYNNITTAEVVNSFRFSLRLFLLLMAILYSECENSNSGVIANVMQKPWFFKLPDYYLQGVPKILVKNEKYWEPFLRILLNFSGLAGQSEDRILQARNLQLAQKVIDDFVPFLCSLNNTRSPLPPSSAHMLRPGDIDVVAALGDSLTAGLAALTTTIRGYFNENRGITAFIGGQGTWRDFTTLPNILKVFNPKLFGYSSTDSLSRDTEAGFNMAESGAMSHDLYHMTKILVAKIKRVLNHESFNSSWKMVTLAIGTNDFCSDICYINNLTESVERHKQHLLKALRHLRDNMPRTVVNFMQTLGIHYLKRHPFPNNVCAFFHRFSCSCLFGWPNEEKVSSYLNVAQQWQDADQAIFSEAEFRDREDFVILLQPMLTDIVLPTVEDPQNGRKFIDLSYWAPDCFHYNQKLNSKLAIAAWNSLLTPDGTKTVNAMKISNINHIRCPTEDNPYIYTWKNSQNG